MARRMIIGPSGLKVSKPGYDAAAAASANLLFNSDGSPYNAIGTSGKIFASAFAETSQTVPQGGTQFTRVASAYFGKTYSSPPRAFVAAFDPNNGGLLTTNLNLSSVAQGSQTGTTTGSALTMFFEVFNDHLTVTVTAVNYNTSLNRNVDVAYILFLN